LAGALVFLGDQEAIATAETTAHIALRGSASEGFCSCVSPSGTALGRKRKRLRFIEYGLLERAVLEGQSDYTVGATSTGSRPLLMRSAASERKREQCARKNLVHTCPLFVLSRLADYCARAAGQLSQPLHFLVIMGDTRKINESTFVHDTAKKFTFWY